jgi:Xaa-Pro aminopeptidase
MDQAIRAVQPGMTEYQIAALLGSEAQSRGLQPVVNLIATDERIYKFRHPLPTDKKLERYAMLVLCGRRWGLVCSLTRLVYFGRLPAELRSKSLAVAKVDATIMAETRPGRSLGEIFARIQAAYAEAGYPDEWKLHHQGGSAGYEPREVVATPGSPDMVNLGQAYAWNPSITGTKSEDTLLVGPSSNEILTCIPAWPVLTIQVGAQKFERPAILELA